MRLVHNYAVDRAVRPLSRRSHAQRAGEHGKGRQARGLGKRGQGLGASTNAGGRVGGGAPAMLVVVARARDENTTMPKCWTA
jgi:hypothetical protein